MTKLYHRIRVMILGSWHWALPRALCWAWSLLKNLSLSPPPPPSPVGFTHTVSLSKKTKKTTATTTKNTTDLECRSEWRMKVSNCQNLRKLKGGYIEVIRMISCTFYVNDKDTQYIGRPTEKLTRKTKWEEFGQDIFEIFMAVDNRFLNWIPSTTQ